MFSRPEPISSLYSYEDCTRSVLKLVSGLFVCEELGQFTVDVPPLTPPFSYNYGCSSVILTSYIPVYIYMYALLAVAPLVVMLFGLSSDYSWFPAWIQARFPGILWPLHWSMEGSSGLSDSSQSVVCALHAAQRVRTTSDMSSSSEVSVESDVSDPRVLKQSAEPKLVINVVSIVTNLMHNIYILSTFGLCSPYLAVVIVICNTSHIVLWKILLGRFVICRVVKSSEDERKRSASKSRDRAVSHDTFLDFNVHELMEQNTSTHDAALITLSDALYEARGVFAICIWPILVCSSVFFMFVSADIAGDRLSWRGGQLVPVFLCAAPLLFMWGWMKTVMKSRAGSGKKSESSGVELSTVENVMHASA